MARRTTVAATPQQKLEWQEKREGEIAALRQQVEDGLEAILSGEAFRAYLATAAKFHRYSWHNQLLIWMQRPDATHVAGFRTWQMLNRQVRKGEKSIRILAPAPFKTGVIEEDGTEQRRMYFKPASVFDISQTDGEPIAEPPTAVELQGEHVIAAGCTKALVEYVLAQGWKYEVRSEWYAKGSWTPASRTVTMRDGLSASQHVKTLFHEVGHAIGGHRAGDKRADIETVAEIAAFMACGVLGFDTSQYTLPYVATWAQEMEVVRRNMDEAVRIARELLDVVGYQEPERRQQEQAEAVA